MKKIFYLSTCSTCKRIISEINPGKDVTLQDIKTTPLTPEDLEKMHALAGSYEALFSRRSMKYRSMDLHEQTLGEKEYRKYILEEYTFLKRPVIISGNTISIGSSKEEVEKAKKALHLDK